MKSHFCIRAILLLLMLNICGQVIAADRYWVHKPFYENFFTSAAELAQWNIVEDNGTGSWSLTGNGTALLKMDNAAGGYANRMFNINGASANFLPLDRVNGRVEIMVNAITGGNQRIFVQVQQFNASGTYISEFSILPSQSATGFFTINLSSFNWDPLADKVRFIIGGENFSGQQGTVEFDYFSYSNSNGNWNNSANWSAVPGGAGGASVPGLADAAIFDGLGGSNGSCVLSATTTIAGLQMTAGYSGNFDLQGYQLSIGSAGVSIAGGGVTGNGAVIQINGNMSVSGGAYKNTNGFNYVIGDMNFSGGTLDFSSGHVIFDAAGNQSFTSTLTNPIHKLIINKPSGTITFNSDVLVADSLLLTQGMINANGYTIRLGQSASTTGTLIAGSGRISGTMKRWIAAATTGNVDFPMGDAAVNALFSITVNSAATTGGSVTVTYNDAAPSFIPVAFADGSNFTILNRSAAYWSVQTTALTGGSYSLSANNTNLAAFSNLSDLRLTLSASVAGSHQAATGTLVSPVLHRGSLSVANLAQTWHASLAGAVRRKIAVIGSSTAAGVGPSVIDSAWVNRVNYYYKNQLAAIDTTYNLAVSGTTSYSGMPTSYIAPGGRPSPDPAHNVSKAVSLLSDLPIPSNGVIIVNFPTNGYDTYSVAEIMSSLQLIYDSATAGGNRCFICTTQPRSDGAFGGSAIKRKLADIKDSIINRFGLAHTINFWDGMFNPADTTILSAYSAGDNTHFNNTGHRMLLNRVMAKNIFSLTYTPSTGDYRSNVSPTGLWSDVTSWQTYNGTAWVAAVSSPNFNDGTVTVLAGDSIRINSAVTIDQVVVENGAVLTMFNTGTPITVTLNDGAGNDIDNYGNLYVSVNGTLTGSGNLQNNAGGLFTIRNLGILQVNTVNDGSVNISGTGYLQNATLINNRIFTLTNFTLNINNATLVNNDSLSMAYAADNWFAGTGASYLLNNPGAVIYKPTTTGIANMNGTLSFTNSGSLKGVGQYSITNTLSNNGIITPGAVIAALTVNPSFITGKTPTLNLRLQTTGAVAGTNDDQLILSTTGNTNITGATLNVTDNANDPVGTVYTIVVSPAGTITGPFASVHLSPTLGNIIYNSNAITIQKISAVLPLAWGIITTTPVNGHIDVRWSTFQEINTSKFVVEHSTDGISFAGIGEVKAAGYSALQTNYSLLHKTPAYNRLNYYRIKEIDLDGRIIYSVICSVKITGEKVQLVQTAPNPVNNTLRLTVNTDEPITVQVTDNNGKQMASMKLKQGNHTLNTGNWPAGIYYLSVYEKGQPVETKQLIRK